MASKRQLRRMLANAAAANALAGLYGPDASYDALERRFGPGMADELARVAVAAASLAIEAMQAAAEEGRRARGV